MINPEKGPKVPTAESTRTQVKRRLRRSGAVKALAAVASGLALMGAASTVEDDPADAMKIAGGGVAAAAAGVGYRSRQLSLAEQAVKDYAEHRDVHRRVIKPDTFDGAASAYMPFAAGASVPIASESIEHTGATIGEAVGLSASIIGMGILMHVEHERRLREQFDQAIDDIEKKPDKS